MKTRVKKRKVPRVRLAIIGAGGMAGAHVRHFREIDDCEIVAAVDVDQGRVQRFCETHGIPAAFTRVGELLDKVPCDAVSIVTPDATHGALSIQCARAGKHVLCEKPLALDYPEARRMLSAVRRAGVVHMVNFSYRNWPCSQAVAAVVQRGDIGEVRHVEASYLQSWLSSTVWGDWRTTPAWLWRLSSRHGSKGVLGDVGVHIVDFATFPAGPIASVYARLKTFPKAPRNRVGEYVLDANDSAVLSVEFANGALGTIHTTRWASGHENRLFLKISGTRGAVEIDSERSTTSYRLCVGEDLHKARWSEVKAPATPSLNERFIRSILTRRPEQPDFARGAEIQAVLDACFESNEAGRPVKV
ncbi:MAG TPA: Gfo/Idh/MocA family oxidoreductase [Opitutaceae bacterium]